MGNQQAVGGSPGLEVQPAPQGLQYTCPATGTRKLARKGTAAYRAVEAGDVEQLLKWHRDAERHELIWQIRMDGNAGRKLLSRHLGPDRFRCAGLGVAA